MKFYSILLFSLLANLGGIGDIAEKNKLKRLGMEAYKEARYQEAAQHFRALDSLMDDTEESIVLNLAHSYYNIGEKEKAIDQYDRASRAKDKMIRAAALNQMGIIYSEEKKLEEALEFFKESLRVNPDDEDTRYNYELTKKLLEQQKEQQDKNKDQQDQKNEQENQEQKDQEQKQQDQQQQDQKDQEQQSQDQNGKGDQEENKEQQKEEQGKEQQDGKDQKSEEEKKAEQQRRKQQQERMEKINMSEERAKMLLEAMKNQEVQYYQQLRKKAKPRKKSRGKPDW